MRIHLRPQDPPESERSWRGVGSGILALLILNVLGCDGLNSGGFPVVPPLLATSGTVDKVKIIPGVVHVFPDVEFLIEAVPENLDEDPISDPGWVVDWTPSDGLVLVPDPDRPVFAKVRAKLEAQGTEATIQVSIDGVSSSQAKVVIGSLSNFTSSSSKDRLWTSTPVSASGLVPVPQVALLDARVGTNCWWDKQISFLWGREFQENLLDGCGGTPYPGPEVAIFSGSASGLVQDRASLQASSSDLLTPPVWTDLHGDLLNRTLDGPAQVQLELWNGQGTNPDIEAEMILASAAFASEAFRLSRAGISFRYGPVKMMSSAGEVFDGVFCPSLATLQEKVDPCISSSDQVIHVLFVNFVDAGTVNAARCPAVPPNQFQVILLDYGTAAWSTLLHELGHAFALNSSNFSDPAHGHTNGLDEFNCTNAMRTGEDLDCPSYRSRFTIGQVFRMWADQDDNFLNQTGHIPLTRPCSWHWDDSEACPILSLDIEGTGG